MRELQAWWLGRQEYLATVALQEELVRQRRAGERPDTLLLLEHEAVVTVGRNGVPPPALRADPSPRGRGNVNVNVNGDGDGDVRGRGSVVPLPQETHGVSGEGSPRSGGGGCRIPVVETSRGGQATYHGPGQLVAYPIMDLTQHRRDLHWYLRQLEAAGIDTLRQYGVVAGNREGYTGVWIGERKIASIGVAVRGWVTYHGLALNVNCDLAGFSGFSPCGLSPQVMTSLAEQGVAAGVEEVAAAFAGAFQRQFGYDKLLLSPGKPGAVICV